MKNLIFILLLSFFSFSSLAAQSAQGVEQKFLRNYARTVVLLNEINAAHTKSLKDCACYLAYKKGQTIKECGNVSPKEPEFIQTVITFYGETAKRTFSCEKVLEAFVNIRLKNSWDELRQSMALMKPEKQMLERTNAYLTEVYRSAFGPREEIPNRDYKFTVNVKHDIPVPLWRQQVNMAEQKPLSKEETATALATYKKFGEASCMTYWPKMSAGIIAKIPQKERALYQKADRKEVCRAAIYSPSSYRVVNNLDPLIKQMHIARVTQFRKKHRANYERLVQENPLLLLLSSPTPSYKELVPALDFIAKNADKRFRRSLSEAKKGDDLVQFVAHTHASKYAEATWQTLNLSPELYAENFEKASTVLAKENRKHMLLEVGGIVALAVGCSVPWGKALGAGLKLLRFSCIAGVGIPLNTYFLLDSVKSYDRAFTELFSNIESTQALVNSLQNINDARFGTILSSIFMPIGMNLVEAKEAARLTKTLMKNLK